MTSVYQLDNGIYLIESQLKGFKHTTYSFHKVDTNTWKQSDVFCSNRDRELAKQKCLKADFIIDMSESGINWCVKHYLPKAQPFFI